jgi:hypothetical protein
VTDELVKTLGSFLSFGAIGLGLALAVLAAVLLLQGAQGAEQGNQAATRLGAISKFMIFGLSLVLIGAGIEVYKIYVTDQELRASAEASAALPDSFWGDFYSASSSVCSELRRPMVEPAGANWTSIRQLRGLSRYNLKSAATTSQP